MLTEEPTDGAYTNDIITAALTMLADSGVAVGLTGEVYQPIEVTLNEGGN